MVLPTTLLHGQTGSLPSDVISILQIHTVFCALLGIMDSTELTVHALRKAPR